MNAGNLLSGHPSLGSWVNYGLGSVNENLPSYVVMLDKTGVLLVGQKIGQVDLCQQLIKEPYCVLKVLRFLIWKTQTECQDRNKEHYLII